MRYYIRSEDKNAIANAIDEAAAELADMPLPLTAIEQHELAIQDAIVWMMERGVQVLGEGYESVSLSASYLLVAEAVNHAAKEIDYRFYDIKPEVIAAAAVLGANDGVTVQAEGLNYYDNPIWYLHHPEVGSVSFHDPYNQVDGLIGDAAVEFSPPYEWNELTRQTMAFKALESEEVVKALALLTQPDYEKLADVDVQHTTLLAHSDAAGASAILADAIGEEKVRSFQELINRNSNNFSSSKSR